MIVLKKDNKSIKVNKIGAEIKSFKIDDEEFIWNKEEFWPKSSPAMFPIVCSLRDDTFIYEKKEYSIKTRHGFARDEEFEVVSLKEDEAIFKLTYSEKTLKMYPFKFNYFMKYKITENGFDLSYLVENLDDKEIYFSMGAHPAFILDKDYEKTSYIEFEKEEKALKYELDESSFLKKDLIFAPELIDGKKIEILDDNFKNDALIFKNTNSEKVYIKNRLNSKEIEVKYTNFPYIAFWKFLKAPFVCIEPWYGINDIVGTSKDIKEKEGIQKLGINDKFEAKLEFRFKKGN